jgi:hypothetical protein
MILKSKFISSEILIQYFAFARNDNIYIKSIDPFCAREEIRTPTPLRALPPQGSASTSFATHAFEVSKLMKNKRRNEKGNK